MKILAIDPGNIESAYSIIDTETYKPEYFGKVENEYLRAWIETHDLLFDRMIIEMVACYGMPVGKEIFDTCVWIGRYIQQVYELGKDYEYIYRKEEKMNICGTMKAKDSNIRQALIDRFGEVGTKKRPGVFYGFKADIWSAYAVGITYIDKEKGLFK